MTAPPRPLVLSSLSHLRDGRVRRLLRLAGYAPRLGQVRPGDAVAVWGAGATADRALRWAARAGADPVFVEDAFLRSLHPGRGGEPALGLLVDSRAPCTDASRVSDLEHLLGQAPLDDTAQLDRAHAAMAQMQHAHLTKYAAVDPDLPGPPPGYVLVIDQVRGDASIRLGGATASRFAEMLVTARLDHPGTRIVIRGHPEARAGHRPGHFGPEETRDTITYWDAPTSPWEMLSGAIAVYVVTSQMGFEAILAGHRPVVFGQPFYAGWGLSDDRFPMPAGRRGRRLTRAQLFAGAMLDYPVWHDPFHDRRGTYEDTAHALAAQARAWREDRGGAVSYGARLWKRGFLRGFFGDLRFSMNRDRALRLAQRRQQPLLIWAGADDAAFRARSDQMGVALHRVEDGFIRSRGLGATLIPPLSLIRDRQGMHFDPSRPCDMEDHVTSAAKRSDGALHRAAALVDRLRREKVTKYNLSGPAPRPETDKRVILVPGQVADDASIRMGTTDVADNLTLLLRARAANPDAFIIYKPHPDVEAGLRPGRIDATGLADEIALNTGADALLEVVDEVWTMTSGLGFEALIRGVPVTCLGWPFYAGWGLTRDLGAPVDGLAARRAARPSVAGLVQAALIDYPRYRDPVTGLPCSVEIALDRIAEGRVAQPPTLRVLSKAQGALASFAWLWR